MLDSIFSRFVRPCFFSDSFTRLEIEPRTKSSSKDKIPLEENRIGASLTVEPIVTDGEVVDTLDC